MGAQPFVYRRVLVGSVVVADEMQLPLRVTACQRFQKSKELNVSMAREAASMHLAAGDLQGGEQAGGAVAGVVVGHARRQSRPHRQRRLGAIKRLNLRFFIHAQHQRSLGRVEIETHDIGQFAVELRVVAEFEGVYPVRLQAVLLPYAMHGGRGQANFFGQAPCAPVGSRLRLAQGDAHHCLFLCGGDPPWTPTARPVAQTVQATTCIPSPPQTHSSLSNLKPFRQRADTLALRAAQHYPRPVFRAGVADGFAALETSFFLSPQHRPRKRVNSTYRMAPMFERLGTPLAARLRIAIGFTSSGRRSRHIGECWDNQCSEDRHFEIFIGADLGESKELMPMQVAAILGHALVHAAVGWFVRGSPSSGRHLALFADSRTTPFLRGTECQGLSLLHMRPIIRPAAVECISDGLVLCPINNFTNAL